MHEQIRTSIARIEEAAKKLRTFAPDNSAILKFISPATGKKEEGK